MSILDLTAVALGKKIQSGDITSVEVTKAVLDQMKTLEPVLNCYVTIEEDKALERAACVQKEIEAGTMKGPLAGVPVAVKDNLCTEGIVTTCSSRILGNYKPAYTAEAVLNLEKVGAVILGKTNMDEFAMGSTTETSAFGATRNPWNPPAQLLLRRHWDQAHLRNCFPVWSYRLRILPGPDRAHCQRCH